MNTFNSIQIKEGLGDCLIAAACAQEYNKIFNKRLELITNSLLEPILKDNPHFDFKTHGTADLILKWPSQINKNLYRLHTLHRFSVQMGFYIDPTKTVDIYLNKCLQQNTKSKKLVCINQFSAEKNRRFIPLKYVNLIKEFCNKHNFEIKWLGSNINNSVTDIQECVKLLTECSLFIGPISFMYHLASALKCVSLLFCSYMPYYKYSHFTNCYHIYSNRNCVSQCEENEIEMIEQNNCSDFCKATEYSEEEIYQKLKEILL